MLFTHCKERLIVRPRTHRHHAEPRPCKNAVGQRPREPGVHGAGIKQGDMLPLVVLKQVAHGGALPRHHLGGGERNAALLQKTLKADLFIVVPHPHDRQAAYAEPAQVIGDIDRTAAVADVCARPVFHQGGKAHARGRFQLDNAVHAYIAAGDHIVLRVVLHQPSSFSRSENCRAVITVPKYLSISSRCTRLTSSELVPTQSLITMGR